MWLCATESNNNDEKIGPQTEECVTYDGFIVRLIHFLLTKKNDQEIKSLSSKNNDKKGDWWNWVLQKLIWN